MKKIVIINHYGITPEVPGATKHYDMAQIISNLNTHNVEFWLCGYNHHTGENHANLKGFKLESSELFGNLRVRRIKSTPYRKNSILRQINIMVFDLITAMKIIFSKDIEVIVLSVPPISIFNVLAIKMKNIKLITDVEDLWPLFLEQMGMKNKWVIKCMDLCANITYKMSDGIAAVSNGMLQYVKSKINVTKKIIWVAPLGVNTKSYFNKKKNINLLKEKIWKDDFKVIYIGAHGRANDLESVLYTINELNKLKSEKKISYIFIGDGDNKFELIKLKNELALENVYFEEAVSSELVPDYLVHADVCLTNLKKIESFKLVRPNKIFQYMSMGKPIICGIWGEAKEIIEEADTGVYIDFTDYSKAAKNIFNFINQINFEKYKLNGMKYIKENGDREKIFKDFHCKILKLIDGK